MGRIKRACRVEDCCNYARAHGLCDKHLKRWQRHGHTESTRPKDWGSREKHPLYGVWTWRRRKANSSLCDVWEKDFWQFVKDVGKSPGESFKLQRVDRSKPYGQDNFEWVEVTIKKRKSETERAFYSRRQRQYRKSEQGKRSCKNTSLKRMFGITLNDYESLYIDQKGVCAICGKPEVAVHHVTKEIQNLAVDHCHETGEIRGLLCSKCNTGLGSFFDSESLLLAAVQYLKGGA